MLDKHLRHPRQNHQQRPHPLNEEDAHVRTTYQKVPVHKNENITN